MDATQDTKEKEINSCRSFLINQIEMINPKIILSLGRVASQILLDSEDAIGKIRGGEIFSDVIKYFLFYRIQNVGSIQAFLSVFSAWPWAWNRAVHT